MKHIRSITIVIEFEKKLLYDLEKEADDLRYFKEGGLKKYAGDGIDNVIGRLEEQIIETRTMIFHLEMRLKSYIK